MPPKAIQACKTNAQIHAESNELGPERLADIK